MKRFNQFILEDLDDVADATKARAALEIRAIEEIANELGLEVEEAEIVTATISNSVIDIHFVNSLYYLKAMEKTNFNKTKRWEYGIVEEAYSSFLGQYKQDRTEAIKKIVDLKNNPTKNGYRVEETFIPKNVEDRTKSELGQKFEKERKRIQKILDYLKVGQQFQVINNVKMLGEIDGSNHKMEFRGGEILQVIRVYPKDEMLVVRDVEGLNKTETMYFDMFDFYNNTIPYATNNENLLTESKEEILLDKILDLVLQLKDDPNSRTENEQILKKIKTFNIPNIEILDTVFLDYADLLKMWSDLTQDSGYSESLLEKFKQAIIKLMSTNRLDLLSRFDMPNLSGLQIHNGSYRDLESYIEELEHLEKVIFRRIVAIPTPKHDINKYPNIGEAVLNLAANMLHERGIEIKSERLSNSVEANFVLATHSSPIYPFVTGIKCTFIIHSYKEDIAWLYADDVNLAEKYLLDHSSWEVQKPGKSPVKGSLQSLIKYLATKTNETFTPRKVEDRSKTEQGLKIEQEKREELQRKELLLSKIKKGDLYKVHSRIYADFQDPEKNGGAEWQMVSKGITLQILDVYDNTVVVYDIEDDKTNMLLSIDDLIDNTEKYRTNETFTPRKIEDRTKTEIGQKVEQERKKLFEMDGDIPKKVVQLAKYLHAQAVPTYAPPKVWAIIQSFTGYQIWYSLNMETMGFLGFQIGDDSSDDVYVGYDVEEAIDAIKSNWERKHSNPW